MDTLDNSKLTEYNTVFALLSEEVRQRQYPGNYTDKPFDGTDYSITGTSNIEMSDMVNDIRSLIDNKMGGGHSQSKYMPGKIDALRYSYNIPLNVALKGTFERQRIFAQEHPKK